MVDIAGLLCKQLSNENFSLWCRPNSQLLSCWIIFWQFFSLLLVFITLWCMNCGAHCAEFHKEEEESNALRLLICEKQCTATILWIALLDHSNSFSDFLPKEKLHLHSLVSLTGKILLEPGVDFHQHHLHCTLWCKSDRTAMHRDFLCITKH